MNLSMVKAIKLLVIIALVVILYGVAGIFYKRELGTLPANNSNYEPIFERV